jgi:hypothetical protein
MPNTNLAVPNTVEVKLHWGTSASEQGVNVLHFLNVGAVIVNQALADALDTTIKGLFTTSGLAAVISLNHGIRQVGVRNLALANQAEFLSTNPGILGTSTGDALPPAVAQCYTLRTALAGKSYRGRVYLGFFAEAASVGATQSAGGPAGQTFLENIRSSLIASPNLHMSVVSRFSGGALRPTPLSTEVNAIQLRSSVWNTQRRRMQAGGAGVIALMNQQGWEMLSGSEVKPAESAA